jgi:hypothetical protein
MRISRPRQLYTGPVRRDYVATAERKTQPAAPVAAGG